MIFSELYSAYYNAVAAILTAAMDHPLKYSEIRQIAAEKAFGESPAEIESALRDERWQIIKRDGTTPLRYVPSMPLTALQKRWLKSVYADPRIRLFMDDVPDIPDTEPLFGPEDYLVFDRYADGDPFGDEEYIKRFRLILDAVRNRYPLSIVMENRKGIKMRAVLMPEHLEYSEKDDKFRLICSGGRFGVINLGRIQSCCRYDMPFVPGSVKKNVKKATAVFELDDRRCALERVLMYFAHFEKQAERTDDDVWRYRITIKYDRNDETGVVIGIMSFGPMVRAVSPGRVVQLIKERLAGQKSCGL